MEKDMKKLIYCLLFMFIILAGCNPKIVQIECVQNNIVADIKEFNISNYNLKISINKLSVLSESLRTTINTILCMRKDRLRFQSHLQK